MAEHENYITLGQLIDTGAIEITMGFPCGDHNSDGKGIPHIRPFNVQPNGKVSLEQIKSIPFDLASGKPTLCQGDIVFNNTNTKELVGKCAVWEGNQEFVFSNHMTRIRCQNSNIINNYLGFAILHHWFTGKSEMLARSHVAQASIIGERFREILVPWKSIHEQTLIASLLTHIHQAISIQEKQADTTLELKKVISHRLFTRSLQDGAHKETKRKDDWKSIAIKDVTLKPSTWNPKKEPRKLIKYVDVSAVSRELSAIHDVSEYTSCSAPSRARKIINHNDTIFATIRPGLKRISKVPETLDNELASTAFCVLRPETSKILPDFLFHAVSTDQFIDAMVNLETGASYPAIRDKDILSYVIALPPLNEQQEIAQILNNFDHKISLHKYKKIALENLFKTLLHKLMTGETRVSELNLSALEKSVDFAGASA